MNNYTLNFAALERQPTQSEIDQFRSTGKQQSQIFTLGVVVPVIVGAIILFNMAVFVTITFALAAGGGYLSMLPWVGLVIVAIAAGIGIYRWSKRRLRDQTKISLFARDNGLTFAPQAAMLERGMLFSVGDSGSYDEVLIGSTFRIGNYSYSTGSGKNRQRHDWGYVAIPLGRHLPNMVLDSQQNNSNLLGLSLSNLPVSLKKDQVVSLEGDFNQYFTLYAPQQYGRDARYIFTPDLMALLIDESTRYDAEVVDDTLYFYSATTFRLTEVATYQSLMRVIATVGTKVFNATDQYADERVVDAAATNIVAPAGQRLRRGIPWVSVLAVVAVIIIQIIFFLMR